MCFLKDNFLGPQGNRSPPPPLPRPLPSLWEQAEWGGDTQVQVGIFQSPSPQAELQAAEPEMQPMQPVQGAWRSSECPRAAPSAVSGRGRAQGVGDVVTTAWHGHCERSAWSCGSVGPGFTEWQGEKTAATLASMLRLLEPPAPIS